MEFRGDINDPKAVKEFARQHLPENYKKMEAKEAAAKGEVGMPMTDEAMKAKMAAMTPEEMKAHMASMDMMHAQAKDRAEHSTGHLGEHPTMKGM